MKNIAFDSDRDFQSKEIAEAYFNLENSFLISSSEEDSFKDKINKKAIKSSFDRYVKQKFNKQNKQKLAEIERLSLEFQSEFVNKGRKVLIR